MKISVILSYLMITVTSSSLAQNAYISLGRQAVLDGDFKKAVLHLEKACVIDSTNANALWMLGYSYYHNESYKKAIAAYNRAISLKPGDCWAYYYRARAKNYLAKDNSTPAGDKEKFLLGSIVDFTKAIDINPSDMKFYQNRGIAYRDYGIFKLQPGAKSNDRARGINSLKASISDLEKVLADNPSRSDIEALLSLSKEKLATAVGHH
jgi:tetratricopeptide (TPR) repeat protein